MSLIRCFTVKLRGAVKSVRGIVRRSFRHSGPVNNAVLTSNIFPPSYNFAASIPPPYVAVDTLVNNYIHAIDKPAPIYSDQYVPPEDIRMAGFAHSELATILEEELSKAVEWA